MSTWYNVCLYLADPLVLVLFHKNIFLIQLSKRPNLSNLQLLPGDIAIAVLVLETSGVALQQPGVWFHAVIVSVEDPLFELGNQPENQQNQKCLKHLKRSAKSHLTSGWEHVESWIKRILTILIPLLTFVSAVPWLFWLSTRLLQLLRIRFHGGVQMFPKPPIQKHWFEKLGNSFN